MQLVAGVQHGGSAVTVDERLEAPWRGTEADHLVVALMEAE